MSRENAPFSKHFLLFSLGSFREITELKCARFKRPQTTDRAGKNRNKDLPGLRRILDQTKRIATNVRKLANKFNLMEEEDYKPICQICVFVIDSQSLIYDDPDSGFP